MSEEKTVTIKKSDLWKYSTFVLIAVVVIGGFFLLKGNNLGTNPGTDTTNTGTNNPTPINAKALIEQNDPVLGDENAGITILEFSDFQCPFCERAYSGAIADFKTSSYFSNGEVNLIYKQFPLNSIHPYAQKAAEASLCAGEQGKFWEMHDKMFENQASLTSTLQSGGVSAVAGSLKQYASQLGLNTAQFNACLDNGKFASEVSKETAQATSAGGQGTPFFVIVNTETGDSTVISGAYPWSQFETAISSIQ